MIVSQILWYIVPYSRGIKTESQPCKYGSWSHLRVYSCLQHVHICVHILFCKCCNICLHLNTCLHLHCTSPTHQTLVYSSLHLHTVTESCIHLSYTYYTLVFICLLLLTHAYKLAYTCIHVCLHPTNFLIYSPALDYNCRICLTIFPTNRSFNAIIGCDLLGATYWALIQTFEVMANERSMTSDSYFHFSFEHIRTISNNNNYCSALYFFVLHLDVKYRNVIGRNGLKWHAIIIAVSFGIYVPGEHTIYVPREHSIYVPWEHNI